MKKKFIISFLVAFLTFAAFYAYAEINHAPNPFAKLIGIDEDPTANEMDNVEKDKTEEETPDEPKEPETPEKEITKNRHHDFNETEF